MWDNEKTNFFDLLLDSAKGMQSADFKKRLNNRGFELKTKSIKFYSPNYLGQIQLKFPLNLVQSLDYFWLSIDPELLFQPLNIPVDLHVYEQCSELCKKNEFLTGKVDQLASLVKFGYCFYTMAEIAYEYDEILQGLKEVENLLELSFSENKISEINFIGATKGLKVQLKTDIAKKFVSNSIAQCILENIQRGALNFVRIERLNQIDLKVRFRNIYIFILVTYLYRDIGIINKGKTNKIRINKSTANLIVELMEFAKIPLKVSPKWDKNERPESPEEAILNSALNTVLRNEEGLEQILYYGELTEDELDELDTLDAQYGQLIRQDLEMRFRKKNGLR